ncbi:MAG: autotransporter domain-containing protein [Alphaproteobacteria bacterium]|nr:autotransporter domain-containing protein [Alphaproteobacteria bacterium]
MKNFFILLLLGLTVAIFAPKEAKADFAACPSGGGDYGQVICGPSISENPNGDGSANEVWSGQDKSMGNFTIFQASLFLTNNSRVNMGNNSILTFDGGGCKSGNAGDDSKCPNDSEGSGEDIWGKTILDINSSEFFQGGGNNPVFNMRDINSIRLSNKSIATFGNIRDNGKFTMLEFAVNDSDLSINSIDFTNKNSQINNFVVTNDENNRGQYRITINNGIKVAKIYNFNLTNADMIIGGNVETTLESGSGAISSIILTNSDLVLNGNKLSSVTAINMFGDSIFKVDPNSGGHVIEMGSAPSIMMESGSTMFAKDIIAYAPGLDIVLRDEGTVLNADRISFVYDGLSLISMDLAIKAKAKIGLLDTSISCPQGCDGSTQINLLGDKLSSYEFGKIIINDSNFFIRTAQSSIDIKNMDYKGSVIKFDANNKQDNEILHIGSINVLNDDSNYKIDLRNQNASIDKINLKTTDQLDFIIDNSSIKFGDITCKSCEITNITGYKDIHGNNASTITINNYNAGSGATGNFFDSINLNVNGSYTSDGDFQVRGESILNINSLFGDFTSINLTDNSTLSINGESKIGLSSGNIAIEDGSALNIKGEQIFKNPNDVVINNNGTLNISAANDFKTLNNDGVAYLGGNSHINTVANNNILNLYSGATIDTLNNAGSITVYGGNYIGYFSSTADSSLLFNVDTKQAKPGLVIDSMNPYQGELAITFKDLSVLKPGLKNNYEIIKTKESAIGFTRDEFEKALAVLPTWFIYDVNIINNEDSKNGKGEIAWINVQRLTDYKSLISLVPGYGSDESIMNIASLIDGVVFESNVTTGLEDVVNSLDLNSCGSSEKERRLLYLAHQGDKDALSQMQTSCLRNMASNMNTLKPVSNEAYALYSHTNVSKSLDTLLESNREYVYSNEIYSWYKGDVGYTSLANKGYDSGFNSINSMFFVGATIAPLNTFNISGMLGFGIGSLNGNDSFFDGTSNTLTAGLAGSYLTNSYYASLSTAIGLTNFRTDRNIAFLDNQYSDNRNPVATSSLSVLELALKAEAGREFIVNSNTFATPKVFAAQSVLNNSGYKEFGSSGALNVESSNLLISDIGIGVELRRELIMPAFTGIKNAFWYPKVGVNLVERFYNAPTTQMKFLNVADDTYASIVSANYSGLLGQIYGSVLYQTQAFALQFGYNGDISVSGYMNHSLNATLKYSFR